MESPLTGAAWGLCTLVALEGLGELSTSCFCLSGGRVSKYSMDAHVFGSQLRKEAQKGMFLAFCLQETQSSFRAPELGEWQSGKAPWRRQ